MIMFNEPDYTWEVGISTLLATGTLTVFMLSVNVLVRCERRLLLEIKLLGLLRSHSVVER